MSEELLDLIDYFNGSDREYLVGVLKRNDPEEMENVVYTANEMIGGRNESL